MNRPMPVSVPPEPTPTTMASTSPSIWRRISGPAADQRESEPGIAGGGLDDGAAGLEAPVGLRRLDHGARRPVLERARGVRALELEKQPAGAAINARDLDERRVADEIEHRCHGGL